MSVAVLVAAVRGQALADGPAATTGVGVPGCDATMIGAVGDLDGDDVPEVVVGQPTHPGGGAVGVRYSAGGGRLLTAAGLGLWGAAFGSSLAWINQSQNVLALVTESPTLVVSCVGKPGADRCVLSRVLLTRLHPSGTSSMKPALLLASSRRCVAIDAIQ